MASMTDIVNRQKYSDWRYNRDKRENRRRERQMLVALILQAVGQAAQGAKGIHEAILSEEAAGRAERASEREETRWRRSNITRQGIINFLTAMRLYDPKPGEEANTLADEYLKANKVTDPEVSAFIQQWKQGQSAQRALQEQIARRKGEQIASEMTPQGAAQSIATQAELMALMQGVPYFQALRAQIGTYAGRYGPAAFRWGGESTEQILNNARVFWAQLKSGPREGLSLNTQQVSELQALAAQPIIDSGIRIDKLTPDKLAQLIKEDPQRYSLAGALLQGGKGHTINKDIIFEGAKARVTQSMKNILGENASPAAIAKELIKQYRGVEAVTPNMPFVTTPAGAITEETIIESLKSGLAASAGGVRKFGLEGIARKIESLGADLQPQPPAQGDTWRRARLAATLLGESTARRPDQLPPELEDPNVRRALSAIPGGRIALGAQAQAWRAMQSKTQQLHADELDQRYTTEYILKELFKQQGLSLPENWQDIYNSYGVR